MSTERRTPEEYVSEDWVAVARAIDERLHALDMTQRELSDDSRVSLAIVRELQRNKVQRRRSTRTLEALSIALGWHPRHLSAVAAGRRPPRRDDPAHFEQGDGVADRISAVEERLAELTDSISEMNATLAKVADDVRAKRR